MSYRVYGTVGWQAFSSTCTQEGESWEFTSTERQGEGGRQGRVSLCTAGDGQEALHGGVYDPGKKWWGGHCVEIVPARQSAQLSR